MNIPLCYRHRCRWEQGGEEATGQVLCATVSSPRRRSTNGFDLCVTGFRCLDELMQLISEATYLLQLTTDEGVHRRNRGPWRLLLAR
eukprot:scaffold305249_cov36-Tisochrysis_lutea.AAC.1